MITQGSIFTEMLALSKREALEREIRAARHADALASEAGQAYSLRASLASWLVKLASRVDATAAGRATAAPGR